MPDKPDWDSQRQGKELVELAELAEQPRLPRLAAPWARGWWLMLAITLEHSRCCAVRAHLHWSMVLRP